MRIISSLLLSGLIIVVSSCGDEAPPKSTIEFNQDGGGSLEVSESNGNVSSFHPLLYSDNNGNTGVGVEYDVEINLSRPVAETTVIRFKTSGNATRSSATEVGDYDIDAEGDLIVIEKGESSATLTVTIFEDYDVEYTDISATEIGFYETLTIELDEVVVGTGKLGIENLSYDIQINEDDMYMVLSWDPQDDALTEDPGDVDMDLIVWLNDKVITKSDQAGPTSYEFISIPGGYVNGTYGFSYNYYDGTSNNLKFYVDIVNLGGTLNGSSGTVGKSYIKTYTDDNINPYTTSGVDPLIVQTGTKSGVNYSNITDITVPPSGSRVQSVNPILKGGAGNKFMRTSLSKRDIELLRKAATGF